MTLRRWGHRLSAHVWTAPWMQGFKENADGRVGCEHVSGLLTRRHARWPRWGPRPSPKQFCGFESRHANRVLWIIGSTDRHLIQLLNPGNNARFRRRPANAGLVTRVIVPMPHGPSRCSITSKSPRRFDRLEFRKVEIDNRPQGLGQRAVLLIVWQRVQPGGIFSLQLRGPATLSFQRWIRERRSTGRRVRTTGAPTARAARYRA